MKTIKFLILVAFLSFYACEKCDDINPLPCGTFAPNSEHCGWTVVTCYGFESNDHIGAIINTENNHTAPLGSDWVSSVKTVPANWLVKDLGQIFGITIDQNENIYLASSDVYFHDGLGVPSSNLSRPYGCGQIFKCSPPSWVAVPFVDIPNSCGNGNGIGNVAYDQYNDQLFATNLEDGTICRVDNGGTLIESYDPWNSDSGNTGIELADELVWGIAVNREGGDVKVYFTKVTMNVRELYSITLVGGAFPTAGSEVLEYSGLKGIERKFTDISMSDDGLRMLLAERGGPHSAGVISLDLNNSGWVDSNFDYKVGGFSGRNSAGGTDFYYESNELSVSASCSEAFWVSGNYLMARNIPSGGNLVYGLEGIQYTGNLASTSPSPTANQDTDLFIDFDGNYSVNGAKSSIGDVEVFDCSECGDPCELNDYKN